MADLPILFARPMDLSQHIRDLGLGGRIVFVGASGAGKTETAHALIERPCAPGESLKTCTIIRGRIYNNEFVIVDTPDLFDANVTHDIAKQEITKCFSLILPGPQVFVLCIKIGKITKSIENSVKHFIDYFGEEVYKFTMVVFTGMDDLKASKKSLDTYIKTVPSILKHLLSRCRNRYIGFNNREQPSERKKQAFKFSQALDSMIEENDREYYTYAMYMKAEKDFIDKMHYQQRMRDLESLIDVNMKEKNTKEEERTAMQVHNFDNEALMPGTLFAEMKTRHNEIQTRMFIFMQKEFEELHQFCMDKIRRFDNNKRK